VVKAVFLEVDGVLNSGARWKQLRQVAGAAGGRIDPDAVKRLKRLIDATGARIVVSSTRRLGCMVQLTGFLERHGVSRDRVIGKTPDRSMTHPRHVAAAVRLDEIKTWLGNHPEVDRFVILDDERRDMGDLSARHVRTTWNDGLLEEHVDRAIAMLSAGEEQSLHATAG
jgi:hypothetical protein